MSSIVLNPLLKNAISKEVGLPFSEITSRSATEIDKHIEAKTGRKLKLGFGFGDVCGRGSVYISAMRFIGLDKNGNITYDYEKMQ